MSKSERKSTVKYRKGQKCPRCEKAKTEKYFCGRHKYLHLICKTCGWSNF